MTAPQQNIPVVMIRENLVGIPPVQLPPGYALRWFRAGDEKLWLDIHLAAEPYRKISPELFLQEFGTDTNVLGQRQCYLLDDRGAPIGTATAWFDDIFKDRKYGRLHWVAVVPEQQRKGFGKLLTVAACHRLRELGHERAFLRTSTARLSAIRLYLGLGFRPLIHSAEEETIWNDLLSGRAPQSPFYRRSRKSA